MKKNSIKLILVSLMMMLVMTGCQASELNDKEIFANAITQNSEAKYSDSTIKINLKVKTNDIEMDAIQLDIKSKADLTDKDNIKMQLDSDAVLLGMDVKTKLYYMDGYMYNDFDGYKSKSEMSLEDFMLEEAFQINLISLDKVQQYTFEEKEDSYVYNIDISLEYLQELLSSSSDIGDDLFNEDLLGGEVTVNELSAVVVVSKDNYILSQSLVMSITKQEEDGESVLGMEVETVYNSINEPVEIEIPDIDEYNTVDNE